MRFAVRALPFLVTVLLAVLAVSGCSDPETSTTPPSETTPSESTPSTRGSRAPEGLSPDSLPVLIATTEISPGTPVATAIEDGSIEESTATRAEFPEDAIIDVELIEGMVAAQRIPRDSIITVGMFVPQDNPSSSSLPSSTSSSASLP